MAEVIGTKSDENRRGRDRREIPDGPPPGLAERRAAERRATSG